MTPWLRRTWIQLTADKRRFSALCVILGLGLLLWARLIVTTNIPKQAVADGEDKVATATPAPDGATSGKTRHQEPVPIALDDTPRHDPFVISPVHFPKPAPVATLPSDTGKSDPEPVETGEHAAARLHAQLRGVVERFDLEGVMVTGEPMAVIDGRTYRLEQWIPAVGSEQVRFQLVEVRPRSIILAYEDHRFELMIAPPGSQ